MLPEIPGTPVDFRLRETLKDTVARLLKTKRRDFPGCQPVSFGQRHLQELESENYFVSEKADGIRCLLLTQKREDGKPQSFLIDRKNTYYFLPFGIPRSDDLNRWQNDTLLDGELVLEDHNGKQAMVFFLLFDCMAVMGQSYVDKAYNSRLGQLQCNVLKPFNKRLQGDPNYRPPFKMGLKKLELAYGLEKVLAEMHALHHKSDGLMFTSQDAPYGIATCETMMKWKPPEENTVDFRVAVQTTSNGYKHFFLEIFDGTEFGREKYTRISDTPLTLEPELREQWTYMDMNGKIIECRYDPQWEGHWRFSRFRDDKSTANHISTYNRIMETIRDPVDLNMLKQHIPTIRSNWKRREEDKKRSDRSNNGTTSN